MKSTDKFTDRVADYIAEEYGIDILAKLMIPEYADVIYAILDVHKSNNSDIQTTSIHIVNFVLDRKTDS